MTASAKVMERCSMSIVATFFKATSLDGSDDGELLKVLGGGAILSFIFFFIGSTIFVSCVRRSARVKSCVVRCGVRGLQDWDLGQGDSVR